MRRVIYGAALVAAMAGTACQDKSSSAPKTEPKVEKTAKAVVKGPDAKALQATAKGVFGTPAIKNSSEDPAVEAARVALGKTLYYDNRLSKNHDLSCNSCHDLANYGVDVREKEGKRTATSEGHKGQFGGRNSPTTYNAFFHVAQFWDGREPDVEAQAKGPVLNPVEMAVADGKAAEGVLKSIPGYADMFKAAFPGDKSPITYDNFAIAVGAFERKLVTPAPIDAFLGGKLDALNADQLAGLELFTGRCASCHMGPGFGGAMYQKLGLIKPYETKDMGRFEATKNEADKYFFKVPSLRNIAKTGPYLHDGSIASLQEMVNIMATHQTGQGPLKDGEMKQMLAFLDSLTGTIPAELIKKPELPASGPKTPKPDPS